MIIRISRHQLIESRQRIFPTGKRRIIYSKHPLLAYIISLLPSYISLLFANIKKCSHVQKSQIKSQIHLFQSPRHPYIINTQDIIHTERQLQKHLP